MLTGGLAAKARMLRLVRPRDLLRPARLRLIRQVSGNTLLPHRRLSHLADLATDLPSGAIVECGTYLGGSAGVLATTQPDRAVWLFDSWEGCPEPGANDVGVFGEPGAAGDFAAPRKEAERFLYGTMGFDRG